MTYDGKAELVVERKVGTFGEIRVSWQITRRNLDTFVQHQDTIVLADKQERALIVVQVRIILYILCLMHSFIVIIIFIIHTFIYSNISHSTKGIEATPSILKELFMYFRFIMYTFLN